MDKNELIALAKQAAINHGLPTALVCAVVEQESNWNPWSSRYEPEFYSRYVLPIPHLSNTEANSRSTSYGLMQIMGQVAREFGFSATYLVELCDPETGLSWGCYKLAKCIKDAGGDVSAALQKYNGGSNPNYASSVTTRIKNYLDAGKTVSGQDPI